MWDLEWFGAKRRAEQSQSQTQEIIVSLEIFRVELIYNIYI